MKKVKFIFGIHLHQPVGNFDWIFEDAYQKSYKPFIDIFKKYPSISLVIHISGPLLEWLEENHPEYLDELADLVANRNIEILSAGFYEPILAVIPDHDKIGQIKKLNKYIKKRFNYNAQGIWLTERVWEPHLAKQICEADISYLAVDDYHFLAAGKQIDELDGYFTTDEQDARLAVFPISQKLRYAIPFQEPIETIKYLQSIASEKDDRVIVMVDDAEKFGVWPGTHENCFGENKWLDRFFSALNKNKDWLETTTFENYYNSNKPKGRIYLPTVSYFEMSEWTLPAKEGESFSDLVHDFENSGKIDKSRQFLRGGMWRNFQNIYDESNWMQKRVSDLSFILEEYKNKLDKKNRKLAQEHLWKAQCNCAYWHGVFGGLYLPHLRHGIYENLIAADKIISNVLPPFIGTFDIDNDGFEEVDLASDKIKIITSTKGGCIREFDILSKNFNLLNTMHQVAESYHRDLSKATTDEVTSGSIHDNVVMKEDNLDKILNVDKFPRYTLTDHFYPNKVSFNAVQKGTSEKGNFAENEYDEKRDHNIIVKGIGKAYNSEVQITKKISVEDNILSVAITVKNIGKKQIVGKYGSELNYALLGGHSDDRYYIVDVKRPDNSYLDSAKIENDVKSVKIVNEYDKFSVDTKFRNLTKLWRFPVLTVSGSESGLEKVYQSSVLIPNWKLDLKPNEKIKMDFKIIIKEL